jgi:hypothetical protein
MFIIIIVIIIVIERRDWWQKAGKSCLLKYPPRRKDYVFKGEVWQRSFCSQQLTIRGRKA